MWPISNTQTFVNYFESNSLEQSECGGITANFSSDVTEVCEMGTVHFTDMSTGDISDWLWTFEGGTPAFSNNQNPTVNYNNAGSWNVTLSVNDGSATYMIEDYMSVFEIPVVTIGPLDGACVFWPPYELTGGVPEGGTYSGPGVSDGMFDPEIAGIGTHTITYTYISDDGCENSAEETLTVDACTGIDEIKEPEVRIYPNPASDIVHVSSKSKMISVSVYNYIGQMIGSVKLYNNYYQFNTTSYPAGVYTLRIETEESEISKRLIVK